MPSRKARGASAMLCPCGSGKPYAECCGRYHKGEEAAPSAEALMRSRYAAFALGKEDYILATWHPKWRPESAGLAGVRWIRLKVLAAVEAGDAAEVEYVAVGKAGGRAFRQRERSRFARVGGQWLYTDGTMVEEGQ